MRHQSPPLPLPTPKTCCPRTTFLPSVTAPLRVQPQKCRPRQPTRPHCCPRTTTPPALQLEALAVRHFTPARRTSQRLQPGGVEHAEPTRRELVSAVRLLGREYRQAENRGTAGGVGYRPAPVVADAVTAVPGFLSRPRWPTGGAVSACTRPARISRHASSPSPTRPACPRPCPGDGVLHKITAVSGGRARRGHQSE
jgi:hypothetical protein